MEKVDGKVAIVNLSNFQNQIMEVDDPLRDGENPIMHFKPGEYFRCGMSRLKDVKIRMVELDSLGKADRIRVNGNSGHVYLTTGFREDKPDYEALATVCGGRSGKVPTAIATEIVHDTKSMFDGKETNL